MVWLLSLCLSPQHNLVSGQVLRCARRRLWRVFLWDVNSFQEVVRKHRRVFHWGAGCSDWHAASSTEAVLVQVREDELLDESLDAWGWGRGGGNREGLSGIWTWSDSVTSCEGRACRGGMEAEECAAGNFQLPGLGDLTCDGAWDSSVKLKVTGRQGPYSSCSVSHPLGPA